MAFKKVLLLVIILAILAITLIWILKKSENNSSNKAEENLNAGQKIETTAEDSKEASTAGLVSENQDVFEGNREEYKKLIGAWDTGCLVADPKNPSAESHKFVIRENGTAQHWRSSGPSCENLTQEKITNNYKIQIPEIGKINFIALNNDSDNIFDIYKFQSGILLFGHGPRDWYPLSLRNFGGSKESRFDAFNDFLKYKKQAN